MNQTYAILFAIIAGIFTTLEVSINSKLGTLISPKVATLHSLLTGALFFFILNLFKGSLSQYKNIVHVSPQWLIGGLFGAFIIYFSMKAIPTLGVTSTLALILSAQLLSALMIDTYINGHPFYFYRFVGVLLLLVAVFFITD